MAGAAQKSDPKLWARVKKEVTGGEKGGRKGQWSARKAQLASAEYKKKGGGYKGPKKADNHLAEWTREDWGTNSGRASAKTGERYLPRKARAKLSDSEYGRTTAKKRADTAGGKQFSRQPTDVARKTATARKTGSGAAAGRRTAAKAAPASKRATAPRMATGQRAASARPRKAAATKTATRKRAAPKAAAGRSAAARGAARKPAANRTATAARRTPRAAATRKTRGGSKR